MENKDETKHSNGHTCTVCHGDHHAHGPMCMWHHGGKHVLIRWILGIAIVGIVFSVGVKIGEFKESVERNYYGGFGGHDIMRGDYNR